MATVLLGLELLGIGSDTIHSERSSQPVRFVHTNTDEDTAQQAALID